MSRSIRYFVAMGLLLMLATSATAGPERYVTLGSAPDDVVALLGQPTSRNAYPVLGREVWWYGPASLTFKDGQVSEWSDYARRLHVWLGDVDRSAAPIERGSTPDQVLAAQGTPTGINRYSALRRMVWWYGPASVTFQTGRVSEWSDYSGTLRVSMGSRVVDAPPVTRGSSAEAVVAAMGTPTAVNRYEALGREVWWYGAASVTLQSGRVTEWSDYGHRLRVSMGAARPDAPSVRLGSTPDEVVAAMGTPTGVNRYEATGREVWWYGVASITLQGGRVAEWSEYGARLKVTMGEARPDAAPIQVGSTRDDVIARLGSPTTIRRYEYLGEEVWGFGLSSVTIRDGCVAGWQGDGSLRTRAVPLPRYSGPEESIPDEEVAPLARPVAAVEESLPRAAVSPTERRWSTIWDGSGRVYPFVAENGSYYGETSESTFRPRTVYVRSYFRRDGTYVQSHYRSRPRSR